jgi:hypothetical protein
VTKAAVSRRWPMRTWDDGTKRSRPQLTSYETYFPLTENPLSEGGIWVNGNQTGAPFGGVQVTGASPNGKAYADHLIGTAYTDSIAFVSPSFANFGPNHYAEIEVYCDPAYTPPSSHEIQLHLRASDGGSPNFRPLYELLIPWNATNGQIVRQDGTLGGFTVLSATGSGWGAAPATGDRFRAEIIGSVMNLYYKPSGGSYGASVMTVTDATIAAGQPGFGLYVVSGTGADPAKFCVRYFKGGKL